MKSLCIIVAALIATAALGASGGEPPQAPRVVPAGWTATSAPMYADGTLLVIADSFAETPDGDVYALAVLDFLPPGDVLLDGTVINVDPHTAGIRSVLMPEDLYSLHPGEALVVVSPDPSAPVPTATAGCSVTCASGNFACCSATPLWCKCKPLAQQTTANCPIGGPGAPSCTAWAPSGGPGGGGSTSGVID